MRPGFWPKCWVCLRWFRISLWLVILAAACLLLWFNQVGLPGFLKERLRADLKERGLLVDFTRMRLRMTRGIVVENMRAGKAGDPESPTLAVGEVQLLLDFGKLVRGHLDIEGLVLRGGRLVVPINEAGQPLETLELTNIQTDLRFKDNDTWALDNFQADFKNTKLALSGDVANATEIRNWEIFHGHQGGEDWQARARHISEVLASIRLNGTPRINLIIEGDARDLHSFDIRLKVSAPGVRTPWFSAQDLDFAAILTAPADAISAPLLPGAWSNAQPFRLAWSTRLTQLRAEKLNADAMAASGLWNAPVLAVTNFSVDLGRGQLKAGLSLDAARQTVSFTNSSAFDVQTIAALLPEITRGRLALVTWTTPPVIRVGGSASWAAWPQPSEVVVNGDVAAANFAVGGVPVDQLQTHFSYSNLVWRVPDLAVVRDQTRLQVDGTEDDNTKMFGVHAQGAFDANIIRPWLNSQKTIREAGLSFQQPLTLDLTVRGRLHDAASLTADGYLALTNFAVDGVMVDQLQTHFSYSNLVSRLPDLLVVRDQTRLQADGTEDENTKIFAVHAQGAFDANMIRPLLKSKTAIREVGRLSFRQPLILNLTAHGRLDDAAALTADGSLALTNFSVRGGAVDSLATGISYSNRVLVVSHPEIWRLKGAQHVTADAIIIDLNELLIRFENGFSTADPQFVADSIGPKTGRTVEPYQFLTPPTARVNGWVSLRSSEDNSEIEPEDLEVDILEGAPFRWLRFNTRSAQGQIRWLGGTLDLTNMNLEFYRGHADGYFHFDFRPVIGTDFSFALNVTNANLHWLMTDLDPPTNSLEGLMGGRVVVTSANSTNWQAMSGYGNASLHDGLLWDAPMFGVLSKPLNALVPGMGSSRATDAAGNFTMVKGVIYSDSLEIHSTMMRLHYKGIVDLHENIDAVASAELLRDTPGFGELIRILSWPVTKLFEYKVTGTLGNPKMTPLYDISKLLLAPLHPIKSLEAILPAGNTNSSSTITNAPGRK